MEHNRLLEIAAERAMCDLCADCGDDACITCHKRKGVTAEELREYHSAVYAALRRTAEDDCSKCIITSGAHEASGKHIRDLLAADEEGRLIILPPSAKEGDPKPECFEDYGGSLWCLGYQRSETDDEPCERCKKCWYCESGDYADDGPRTALGGGEGG